MRTKFFSMFDYFILAAAVILMIFSILFIYSSGINSSGVSSSKAWYRVEYIKQIIWLVTGLVLFFIMALLDYRKVKPYILWVFIAYLVILVFTRLFGRYVNGAKSWIGGKHFGIQPSEFGKIIFIMFLSAYMEKSENENPLKRFVISLAILAGPVMLILIQPDMGTASVYIPIFLIICYMAGVPLKYILLCLFSGMLTIILTVLPIWEIQILKKDVLFLNIITDLKLRIILIAAFGLVTVLSLTGNLIFKKSYYYWISYVCGIITFSLLASIILGKVLKEYQIMRLIVFLNPEVDPKGAGWNIIQSKIAIGSGGFVGQGFLKGTQSHLRFLPQQSTDFIFSILSEEWGFIGGFFVFVLYLVILYRGYLTIKKTTDTYGVYIATGVCAMFLYHFLVNVGMVMGIMPITGIPLLLMSYGGSSVWTAMMALGLLESINLRRFEYR